MTVFLVKLCTRVCIAREAQLVEQSIEAALVVSSSLISSKLSVINLYLFFEEFYLFI